MAEWTSRQKKETTERVLGLGRRTREEIVKWNQMTTLRFQTGDETTDTPEEAKKLHLTTLWCHAVIIYVHNAAFRKLICISRSTSHTSELEVTRL